MKKRLTRISGVLIKWNNVIRDTIKHLGIFNLEKRRKKEAIFPDLNTRRADMKKKLLLFVWFQKAGLK